MKNLIIILICATAFAGGCFNEALSQNNFSLPDHEDWNDLNLFKSEVFIANNGQHLPEINGHHGKILYHTQQQGVNIFWNQTGLTYKVIERKLSEEQKEEIEKEIREGHVESEPKPMQKIEHYLNMEWIGANPAAEVIGEQKASHYFTYADPSDENGRSGIKTYGYNKIIYKNIYPGIDAQYQIHKKGGIKYSFIVHPGADISMIKIRYKEANNVQLNQKGEVEIYSMVGGYIEHAPETFYDDGTAIPSNFQVTNSIISFNIPDYDKNRTVIIDPWVSKFTDPGFTNPTTGGTFNAYKNIGYDVAYDVHGNVWAYGGGDPFFLAKYNNIGVLQWVFTVPLVGEIVGDFDINKQSGTAYVSEGWADLGARVVKVNSAGMLQATSPKDPHNEEIGSIKLDCNGKLYTTGGGAPVTYSPIQWQACSMDTNLTALTGQHITSSINVDHDVSLMCIDPSTNAMYLNFNRPCPGSPDFLNDNEMHRLPLPAFTPSDWMIAGPVYGFTELVSIRYAGPCLTCFGNVPARLNVFNGMVAGNGFLYTYDGNLLKKFDKNSGAMLASVTTSGKRYWSGGIDLDLCENIYVSVSNAVEVYDASLSLINTYPLSDTSCYDLKVDKDRNKLYATGNNYVMGIDINPPPVMQLTTTITPPTCACDGIATASMVPPSGSTVPCNSSSYNYSWLPGGQTTATISGLCPGTYTVIAETDIDCGKSIGDTAIVVIPQGTGGLNTNFTYVPNCGQVTFSNTDTIASATWSWSFPGGTPATANTQNPPLINYPAGTYTATLIVDAGNGCADTIVHSFTIGGGPTAAITPSAPCIGGITNLQDGSVAAANDPIVNWDWLIPGGSPSGAATQNTSTTYSAPGTYTVSLVVTAQSGCKDTIDQQVIVYNSPTANFSAPDSGCAPVCINFQDLSTSIDGNISNWQWTFPGGSTNSSTSQNPGTICYNTPGSYGVSLVVTSQYGCTDSVNLPMVDVFPWPKADFCVTPNVQPTSNPIFSFCDQWSSDVVAWMWNFGDNDTDHTSTDPVHSYENTANQNDFYSYQICINVKNSHGCWDTACKIVEIIPEFEFYIPNTFTPNGDWYNETFYGKGRGIKEYSIWVFDRWGNQIWDCHTEDKNTNWDSDATTPKQEGLSSFCQWDGIVDQGGIDMSGGSHQLAQEDVYVWKVRLTDIFDREHSYIGHVNIVR